MKYALPERDDLGDAIAIVGLAGRFPGARSVAEFWSAIREGRELFRPHRPETLADAFTDAERARPDYVPVRPSLDDVGMFDARFFNMLPREASVTDPQFRVFLEVCWEALEDSGHDPARPPGPIGVFGGASMSTYFLNHLLTDRAAIEEFVSTYQLGDYQPFLGALSDTLATRVAFKLALTGPAVTVASACSTSLVAVAQAVQSLRSYQCDMALAGGVSITFPQERGYFYKEGGMASRDGHCRPFDAQASGTVFGHGAGAVALRRLDDAVAEGDSIYALIRGVGINNDGDDKIAFTAPSVRGQALAVVDAQADAGVEPSSIGYVECHGTGTPLGDPVEFEGLRKAFAGVASGRVQLGSVKANLGHLDAAAGVVGLIKTALMLREKVVPPMGNFTAPNPMIPIEESPFRIPTEARPWTEAGPLRAGVSALGVGGTNAHVVLEEAPPRSPEGPGGLQVLPISARSEAALDAMAARLADALTGEGAPNLADAAFTLQEGRRTFDHRRVVAASSAEEAAAQLRAPTRAIRARSEPPRVCFMFPGQGAQYPRMASGLYGAEPLFRELVSQGSALLEPLIGLDLGDLVFGELNEGDAARALRNTAVTQPALYLIEYATARLWQVRGIAPAAMVGHSVGEFVAATLSGVMDFETGLKLVAARGRLMQEQPRGAMLSVRAPLDRVAALVPEGVDLAARNAPMLNVFAGPEPAIEAFEAALKTSEVAFSRLHTSHAFHSEMMTPVVEAIEREAARCDLQPPLIPFVSCVTGSWITAEDAVDPGYWARHCRASVEFERAVRTLSEGEAPPVLLEVGPGRTLSAFAAQALPRDAAVVVQSLPDHTRAVDDLYAMATAQGTLWAAGVPIDWAKLRSGPGRRVSLPTYPFERTLHWIEPPVPLARQSAHAPSTAAPQSVPPTQLQTPSETSSPMLQTSPRTEALTAKLLALLSDLSGENLTSDETSHTFLELGFDSLLLGQVAQRLAKDFGLNLSFRQLMTEFPTADALLTHMAAVLPPEPEPASAAPVPTPATVMTGPAPAQTVMTPVSLPTSAGDLGAVMQAQTQAMLALFDNQLRALNAGGATPAPAMAAPAPTASAQTTPKPGRAPVKASAKLELADRFDLNRRRAAPQQLTPEQQAFIDRLCADYSAKFPTSKSRTQEHRRLLADPRTAAGFRPEWKELVFPIIAERSSGSRLHDPDGNELIDLVNGFGQTAFGHAPGFVKAAVAAQMEKGFPIGPQTPLAHEVARKFLAVTGHERVTFCNTGSEAVMAAMRIARTVTGRDTVVCFKGDYHGQFDEVLVKGRASGDPTALPAVAGVPGGSVSNMVVLAYGAEESLDWIRDNRDEIAAILVEPVQSRHPELRPRAFCEELRRVTAECGAALVFDEIVTGFRVARGGMQEYWGIKADLATYGKVVGGGMPVGVLAGSARFMDALDGGFWSFGDGSVPEVPPTFFAGTFVRHPLVLAAVDAVLDHLSGEEGRALYDRVAPRTGRLLEEMNDILEERGLPRAVTGFSSWLIVSLSEIDPRSALLYPLMRLGGIHVHDGYPWFFTTAHGEADFEKVAEVFAASVDRLQSVGLLPGGNRSETDAASVQVPLTAPQREVWMAAQLGDAASGVFIESCTLRFEGALDHAALEAALNEVIARHDALRMVFAPSGEHALVAPRLRLSLKPEDMDRAALDAAIADDARTPFDLVEGPLVRVRLARLGPDEHVLILSYHHIICDGWSVYLLLEELSALYNAQVAGTRAEMAEPQSFAAYASAQAGKSTPEATAAFWKGQFPAAPELPELPTDATRPGQRSFAGATHVHRIDADLARALKKTSGREGVTMFAALAGALALMLARMSGARDVVLAVPTAGQTQLPNNRLVGHCVNFLPIRLDCDLGLPLRDHLQRASKRILDCFDHGDITYGTILQAAGIRGDVNRQPLSEVQFNLDQQPADFGFAGLTTSMAGNPRAHTNFDLIFNVTESPAGLRIDLTYATDVLTEATAARWCRQYQRLLEAIVESMETSASRAPLLPGDEATAIAAMGQGPGLSLPPVARFEDLVARQAEATPDAVAVEDDRRRLSYAELMRESDQLGAEIQRRIPQPGGRVAVLVERSADVVVALLGVLKAGHAYVPLDPGHPPSRLRSVLQAAEVQGLVHKGSPPDTAEGLDLRLIDMDGDLPGAVPTKAEVEQPTAYVIFTSGSTGTPKGVEVPHSAVINFLLSMREKPGFTSGDSLLSVTTISFDIAALELFLPLVTGGRVVVAAAQDVKEAFPLVERLGRGDIGVVQATPTLWQMLIEAGLKADSRLKVLVGGEPLPRDLADRLLKIGGEVWNLYGPTETTIWSSCGRVGEGPITIGGPIANTTLYVLDGNDALAPIGVAGELNIGGAGLAKGYFGRPDLTEAAFRVVDIPGSGPQRLYRTGDLAVRRADGSLVLLGRSDGQIKLRGFRIELGDVEAAIRSAPGVKAAAAALRGGASGQHLVGYYVGGGEAPAIARTVGELLPNYMVPTRWQRLDALPQTANGKLDRKALPDAEATEPAQSERRIVPPATPLEETLVEIWSEVLGIRPLGTNDNLFDLGADSLSIFRIAARMLDRNIGLEAKHLMLYPTISSIAAFAGGRGAEERRTPSLKDFRNGARRGARVGA